MFTDWDRLHQKMVRRWPTGSISLLGSLLGFWPKISHPSVVYKLGALRRRTAYLRYLLLTHIIIFQAPARLSEKSCLVSGIHSLKFLRYLQGAGISQNCIWLFNETATVAYIRIHGIHNATHDANFRISKEFVYFFSKYL